MSALSNGSSAAQPGDAPSLLIASKRFSDIPDTIDIPVGNDEDEEAVELDAAELGDDPGEVCQLLEQENVARRHWQTVAFAYAKQNKFDHAIETISRGISAMRAVASREDRISLIATLCWMYLWKCREAPRVTPDGLLSASDVRNKDYYLTLATSTLNEATRISPSFPPVFLARGVLQLLRASLVAPSKTTAAGTVDPEKADLLHSATKAFDDTIRTSNGRNMMAVMGKARALYSLHRYADALACYQQVLQRKPDMVDPDPRVGIGCCLWQLGHKDDARGAWERCLEINPGSKHANVLLGLCHLEQSAQMRPNSPEFILAYKKAMTEYIQKSFKLDNNMPLACVTFAAYFLSRKNFANADALAHKAIRYTDVNAVASDGWYLLARREHYDGNAEKAINYYRRADDARGGTERGYPPAKFGMAQLSVLRRDLGEAKLVLEKLLQQSAASSSSSPKNYEAMVLLGSLYAEEVFAAQLAGAKEETKAAEAAKAVGLLEAVRAGWKDPKKGGLPPDPSVLLNLARLYEADRPDKALQCLLQAEQLELAQLKDEHYPEDRSDEAAVRAHIRRHLPPQLLNNIGCFYFQAQKHELASEMFEAALSACVRIDESRDAGTDTDTDTDPLVTTLTFNLARSYEARGMTDQAVDAYEKLLERHADYVDARTRLAYIRLRKHPTGEGPSAVSKLYQEYPSDLEVRALYGWYLGKIHAKRKLVNVQEDDEFRHFKHTLQQHDKHDRYALVAMGNLLLMQAREMRRDNELDRQKRSSVYSKAVEFFEKALSLDPKNAYAAQGVAIALFEDRKDIKASLPVFLKVRDTVKDPHVFVNLGHIFTELKQYAKAIENYETALAEEGKANDPHILACLGRVWLNRGRSGKDLESYGKALEYAELALAASPDQIHYKFNVAYVQIQLATILIQTPEMQRSVSQLEAAAAGLEAATAALDEIAAHPQPPYPQNEIKQRATMARNTLQKQLDRAILSQKDYQERNKEKIKAALERREVERCKREQVQQAALEKKREERERIRKDREAIIAHDMEVAAARAQAERERLAADMTTDSETGQKVKRKRKAALRAVADGSRPKRAARKKKAASAGTDEESDRDRPTKRRRLVSGRIAKESNKKFKSAEIIVDSDEDFDEDDLERAGRGIEKRIGRRDDSGDDLSLPRSGRSVSPVVDDDDDVDVERMDVDGEEDKGDDDDDDDDDAAAVVPTVRRQAGHRGRRARVLESSDEEDEDDGGGGERTNGHADAGDDQDDGEPATADASMADAAEED